jgi:hypothetical protein
MNLAERCHTMYDATRHFVMPIVTEKVAVKSLFRTLKRNNRNRVAKIGFQENVGWHK